MQQVNLSDKEIEVLALIARGHDAKSAARELTLSPHTIYQRLRRAREKLGANNSREAARLFFDGERAGTRSDGSALEDAGIALSRFSGEQDVAIPPPRLRSTPSYQASSFGLDSVFELPLRPQGERLFEARSSERIRLIGDLSAKLAMVFVSICLAALALSNVFSS